MPRRIPLVPVNLAADVPRHSVTRNVRALWKRGEITAADALRIMVNGPAPGPYWLPKSVVDEVLAA